MLLVMDVGNTNVVIGIYKDKTLIHQWRLATDRNKTEDEYGTLIKMFLMNENIKATEIESVIISSVVPPLMFALERMVKKYFKIKPLVVGPGIRTGLNIKYENPKEVGADPDCKRGGSHRRVWNTLSYSRFWDRNYILPCK